MRHASARSDVGSVADTQFAFRDRMDDTGICPDEYVGANLDTSADIHSRGQRRKRTNRDVVRNRAADVDVRMCTDIDIHADDASVEHDNTIVAASGRRQQCVRRYERREAMAVRCQFRNDPMPSRRIADPDEDRGARELPRERFDIDNVSSIHGSLCLKDRVGNELHAGEWDPALNGQPVQLASVPTDAKNPECPILVDQVGNAPALGYVRHAARSARNTEQTVSMSATDIVLPVGSTITRPATAFVLGSSVSAQG